MVHIRYWGHGPVWFDLTQHGHQYGVNWHNMANLTNIHQKPTESRVRKNSFYFLGRAIQGVQFVRGDHRVVFHFWALGGHSPTREGQFCLLIPNVTWLSYLRDILGPNLPVGPMFWWYQDKILLICCWGHDPLINLAQHGHQCGLIWLSIVNCLLPLRIGNWKYSQENTFSFSEWQIKVTLGMGVEGRGLALGVWGWGWGWGRGGWWWWVVVVVGRPRFFFSILGVVESTYQTGMDIFSLNIHKDGQFCPEICTVTWSFFRWDNLLLSKGLILWKQNLTNMWLKLWS